MSNFFIICLGPGEMIGLIFVQTVGISEEYCWSVCKMYLFVGQLDHKWAMLNICMYDHQDVFKEQLLKPHAKVVWKANTICKHSCVNANTVCAWQGHNRKSDISNNKI